MIDAFADEVEYILLRVGFRIDLNAIRHAPRQRRDVAAWRRGHDTRIERGDVGRQRAAAGNADATELLGIDFRQRRQIIEAAHSIPNPKSGQTAAEQIERIAEHGMFAATEIESALRFFRIPKLAPLRLTDWIVREHDKAAPRRLICSV